MTRNSLITLSKAHLAAVVGAIALLGHPWPAVAQDAGCNVGFLTGTSITNANIDGNLAGQWSDASAFGTEYPCMDAHLWDANPATHVQGQPTLVNQTRQVEIYSKRDATNLYIAFVVEDATSNTSQGGALLNGERIVLQFDPDGDFGNALDTDFRIELRHKWAPAPTELTLLDTVGGACAENEWGIVETVPGGAVLNTSGIRVGLVSDDPGNTYTAEFKIPLSAVGSPSADFGFAFAIINDLGHGESQLTDATGITFPQDLPLNNASNLVQDPDPSTPGGFICNDWLRPDTWGTGLFNASAGNVTFVHSPSYYSATDVKATPCGSGAYSYYPETPCKITIEGRPHNSVASNQVRNLLYLWGDHGTGPTVWRFVDLQQVTIAANSSSTYFPSKEWETVPKNLGGHPCVRVYILPAALNQGFDLNDMQAIDDANDLTTLSNVYGLGGVTSTFSAQRNISSMGAGTNCPDANCAVASLMTPSLDRYASAPGDSQEGEIMATLVSATSRRPSALILLFAGLLIVAATFRIGLFRFGREISGVRRRRLERIALGIIVTSILGIVACDRIKLPPTQPRPGETAQDTPIFLSKEEMATFGREHVIVQVQAFGSVPTRQQGDHNFIQGIGGVIQLIPQDMVLANGEVTISTQIGNSTDQAQAITLLTTVQETQRIRSAGGVEVRWDYTPGTVLRRGETRPIKGTLVLRKQTDERDPNNR